MSRRIATVWVVMAVAIFIGVVGYSLSKNGVMAELKGAETIIIQVATLSMDSSQSWVRESHLPEF